MVEVTLPCRFVVVETEAEKKKRQGKECKTSPPKESARDQPPHAGKRRQLQQLISFSFCLSGSCLVLVFAPFLQKSDHLPHCAHAHNSDALLLAEHADADASPRSKDASPSRTRRGRDRQEDEQSEEEEKCCGRMSGLQGEGAGGARAPAKLSARPMMFVATSTCRGCTANNIPASTAVGALQSMRRVATVNKTVTAVWSAMLTT